VTAAPEALREALSERRPGYGLQRAFYVDRAIYAHELETIWRRGWLVCGLSTELPETGHFLRFDVADDSLVIVRTEDGSLRALHNTCRHRGMPVCPEPSGRVARWVCPYHQWSYALDGTLLGCGGMEAELDGGSEELALKQAAVVELGGLVLVRPAGVAELPAPTGSAELPAQAAAELAAALAPQGLDRAKVAYQIDYEVDANWKLVWENNRECWHCHVGHPQYVKANFDTAPNTESARARAHARANEHAGVLSSVLAGGDRHSEPGLATFPTPDRWWSANRTPTTPGFVTESLDGSPVAPLMGDYPDYDVGTLRVRTVPNFWCHASADHAVLTQLLPAGPQLTRVRLQWLVDQDAVEGRDYELSRLLPFWQLTSEQDWDLCQRQQTGVRSPAYTPGPYSRQREYNVLAFIEWYLDRVGP
jgi:Rieske 2Fe-2S family protein